MKLKALLLCLLSAAITAGCVYHHEIQRERSADGKPMASNDNARPQQKARS
jgi:cytochrome c556